MIVWNIKTPEREYDIDIGECTVLNGQHILWHEVVRNIDDFFNNRYTDVVITEDATVIQKKDWNCFFIPFDASLDMQKITAKSPLSNVLIACITELSNAPAYIELQQSWQELQEECYFVNETLKEFKIKAHLKEFLDSDLKGFLSLSSESLNPIDNKMLILRLISKHTIDKKTLILLELPEIYSTEDELIELKRFISQLQARGIIFIIVSNKIDFASRKNYIVNDQIFNESSIEAVRRVVLHEVPFGAEELDYNRAKEVLWRAVDNMSKAPFELGIFSEEKQSVRLISYMILNKLNIMKIIDTSSFPANIVKFLERY